MLTIDENIQFMAERALDHAMERTQAANGTVVVQDVHTGQILALAIRPTFNPNDFRHTTPALLRNHAVSDVYEPGSVFKLVTYSAALEQHVAAPDDMIDCQGGQITLAGRVIHDNQGEHYGVIPVHEALEDSSDVAAVKLALKVGPDRFYQYIRDFGFGSPHRRGVARRDARLAAAGEQVGTIVDRLDRHRAGGCRYAAATGFHGFDHCQWRRLPAAARADAGTGGCSRQWQDAATPLAPSPFKPGGELPNPLPAGAHRVLSTLTAAQMRKMMEGVVLYGTGKQAQLNGYSSGGKTGTAQKIDPATHLYSKTMHIASFAGIAPVNNPVIAVAVVIDDPRAAYYGTAVSAPVFAEVAQQVLEYLGVPHDIDAAPALAPIQGRIAGSRRRHPEQTGDINALYAAANDLPSDDPLRAPQVSRLAAAPVRCCVIARPAQPHPGAAANAESLLPRRRRRPRQLPLSTTGKTLRVPSLIGLPVRKVIEQAAAAGLEVQITGSGTVREQAPAPGAMVAPGTQIVVRCGRP